MEDGRILSDDGEIDIQAKANPDEDTVDFEVSVRGGFRTQFSVHMGDFKAFLDGLTELFTSDVKARHEEIERENAAYEEKRAARRKERGPGITTSGWTMDVWSPDKS